MPKYSDEELLRALRELADELGKAPTQREMKERGPYSISPYYNQFGSWNDALREAGLGLNHEKPGNNATDKDLLDELQNLAEELGRTPTVSDMRDEGSYGSNTYRRRFGSWNNALREAGLELNHQKPGHTATDEDLLNALRELANELGKTPTHQEMKQRGAYSPDTYARRFGSWNDALQNAGLEPNREREVKREDLIDALRELRDELGRTPTIQEMDDQGPYGTTTYAEEFGSWNKALIKAGLEPNKKHPGHHATDKDLLAALRELGEELGRTPTTREMNNQGPYSASPYFDRFGSWNIALNMVGLETNTERKASEATNRALLDGIKELAEKLGQTPTAQEMREQGPYSPDAYYSRFGSWNNSVKMAGLELNQEHPGSDATDEELLDALRDFYDKLGEVPTNTKMRKEGPYSVNLYRRRFGSWNDALRRAGIDTNMEMKAHEATDEELLEVLRELADELERAPTIAEMREQGPYSAGVYADRFGSWNQTLREAELEWKREHTGIEFALYEILNELGVSWRKEVFIGGFHADALLLPNDIVIEADGLYWHGHPDESPYDEIQEKNIKKDARKDRTLAGEGYHVIRFWENSINTRYKEVKQKIQEMVEGETLPGHGKHVFGPEPIIGTKEAE